MPADWNLLKTAPNAYASFNAGVDDSAKYLDRRNAIQDRTQLKNAYATAAVDPVAGGNALMAAGQPAAAVNALSYMGARNKAEATSAAAPYLAKGDTKGAVAAAAGKDIDYAQHLSKLDAEGLARQQQLGQFAGSILMSAANLPDPAQRRDYLTRNASRLTALGLPPEAVANYDVNDVSKMRADASGFMSLSDAAGSIKTEKLGDQSVTYKVNPVTGYSEVGRRDIPKTRAEILAEQRAAETAGYHRETLDLRREEAGRREEADTPTKVVGALYAKMQRGEPLSKGEQAVLDHYSTGKMHPLIRGALDGSLGGEDEEDDAFADAPPPPPRAGVGRPAAARPAGNGSPPASAIAQMREGQQTKFESGEIWTLRNGKPVRVR